MPLIDLAEIKLEKLITHRIGNKLRDDQYSLSNKLTQLENGTENILLKYFILPLRLNEIFSFNHPIDINQNDIYSIIGNLFSDPNKFVEYSHQIGKLLYEHSQHPKIKEGELNIVLFSNASFENRICNAIGIFKSETDVPFLKMESQEKRFRINHEYGFEIKGLDKGCLIFEIEKEAGYQILIADKTNRNYDAQYWKDDFLKITPVSNEFYNTNQFLKLTKNFVTKEINQEFQLNKADEIDLLNRSVRYFKTHEHFNKKEFEEDVFKDSKMIESFKKYDSSIKEKNKINISNEFRISSQAVKTQSRRFKSVVKLDKNFHIYIHGDRNLIQQGQENDGRKYYKIYFDEEY